jgi:hypothetical protein
MNPNQPFHFSVAEKLVLLASAFAGIGVPMLVIRPDAPLLAAIPLLAAFLSAAAGLALHIRERRQALRRAAKRGTLTAAKAAESGPDWFTPAATA